MTAQINSLITSVDTYALIRDKIFDILSEECANQKILAAAAGVSTVPYDIQIYSERSNAWEGWLNDQSDLRPICNVWFDASSFDMSTGNVVKRQKDTAVFNVDIYALGVSEADGSGQKAGDREAAYSVHNAAGLIRQILMSGFYVYLDMRGTVWRRWIQSRTAFQPEFNGQTIQHVQAVRLSLIVEFNAVSPQASAETLEKVNVTVENNVNDDYFEAEY